MVAEKGSDVIGIEEIRKKAGLTQPQFARTLGLSLRSYLNRITGDQDWKLSELIAIAEKYQPKFEIECGNKYSIRISKNKG